MAEIMVGDKDCSPTQVYNALYNPAVAGILAEKCGEVALNLGVPGNIIRQTKLGNILGSTTTMEAYTTILSHWAVDKGVDATLNNLIESLTNITCFKLFVDSLRRLETEIIDERTSKRGNMGSNDQVQPNANSSVPAPAISETASRAASDPQYKLVFHEATAEELLTKFQIYVINLPMDNGKVTNIISQVLDLRIVDKTPAVMDLKHQTIKTGSERFHELLKLVEEYSNLDDSIIETTFNKLINLEGLPIVSSAFRKRIEKDFTNKEIVVLKI